MKKTLSPEETRLSFVMPSNAAKEHIFADQTLHGGQTTVTIAVMLANLRTELNKQYGSDFSFQVFGGGRFMASGPTHCHCCCHFSHMETRMIV